MFSIQRKQILSRVELIRLSKISALLVVLCFVLWSPVVCVWRSETKPNSELGRKWETVLKRRGEKKRNGGSWEKKSINRNSDLEFDYYNHSIVMFKMSSCQK